MNIQPVFEFRWFSPIGLSVALFLFYGAFYIFIGALAPVMADTEMGQ